VPEDVKAELKQRADVLVETFLKPANIKPPPEEAQFSYVVDIYTEWYRNYFYFCAKYDCPGPNALSPSFEDKFARLEYVGEDSFNVSYMRHTGEWVEIHSGLSMDQCLAVVKDEPHFGL
jgi:hypothetical protein